MSRGDVLHFLNRVEAATLDAMAGRIVPGDDADPGAEQARAVLFIDRSLAGFLRDQQTPYRLGLRRVDELAGERYGRCFRELEASEQDALLGELDQRATAEAPDELGHFFAVVREHVVQGLFCDPTHGGNHGGAGWRLVGFPGARWGYSAREMSRDFDSTSIPIRTLADLYAGDRSVGQ
jgi:gluconate 2-dehydrogenase gamma chain